MSDNKSLIFFFLLIHIYMIHLERRRFHIMIQQQWKPVNIPEVEPGHMMVSSIGNFMTSDNQPQDEYQSSNGFKYILLKLNEEECKKTGKQYRLFPSDDIVAKTFIPIPEHLKDDQFPEVIHKNGISTDNRVDNLEWVSGNYRWANIDLPDVRQSYYQVSNRGEVRRIFDSSLLTLNSKDNLGYNRLDLSAPPHCDRKKFSVHRLVALYFVPGRTESRDTVNHIDGIRNNNYWKNLEWVTMQENIAHASETMSLHHGSDNHNAIINDEDAKLICHSLNRNNGEIIAVYHELRELLPHVSYPLISSIKYGATFNHVSKYILTDAGRNKQIRHDDYETVIDIAKCLKKNKGDVKKTRNEMLEKYPWINLGYIWHLKDKSVSADITDEVFSKDEFPKCLTLNDDIAEEIVKCLMKHKGEKFIANIVFLELKDQYPGLTKDHVRYIKDKRTFTNVSDKYFQKGDLD